jgi:hypothetical protein
MTLIKIEVSCSEIIALGSNVSVLLSQNQDEKQHKNGFKYYSSMRSNGEHKQSYSNLYYKSKNRIVLPDLTESKIKLTEKGTR